MQKNPYSEVSQLNDGRVTYATDTNKVSFKGLKIQSHYDENYFHKITYRLYLTTSLDTMRYVKNCGEYMFEE